MCSAQQIFGLVAQLGAHHIRIVGVGSSNLLESTKGVPDEHSPHHLYGGRNVRAGLLS